MKTKQLIIRLFACFLIFAIYHSQTIAQTVNLGGIVVSAESIPINQVFKEQESSLRSGGIENNKQIGVFKSMDNKYFIKATNIEEVDGSLKSNNNTDASNKIELYDDKGVLKWTKKTELPILRCKMGLNGANIHLITYKYEMYNEIEKLLSYDANGNLLISIDNVGNVYPNASNDIIYYLRHDDDNDKMCFFNCNTKLSWEASISKRGVIAAVSWDGSCVIEVSENGLCSYSKEGNIKWKNPDLIGSIMSLSKNGDYLFCKTKTSDFNLYNNINGEYLKQISNKGTEYDQYKPILGSFILNADNLLFTATTIEPGTAVICVFNIDGLLLGKKTISSLKLSYDLKGIMNQDKTISILSSGIEVDKITINKTL